MANDDALRYPVGPYVPVASLSAAERTSAIADLVALPERLRAAVAGLSDTQLDTPYRPGGWTVRQVAHHLPDSHMNGIIRTKLGLTEDAPRIAAYNEDAWAQLPDARLPIDVSLRLIEAVHERWVVTFRAMTPAQFARTYVHPEKGRGVTLDEQLHNYAWHSRHHVAHITGLRQRMGW